MVGTGATTRPGPARGTEQGTGLDTLQQLQGQRRPWALPDSDPPILSPRECCWAEYLQGQSPCREGFRDQLCRRCSGPPHLPRG